MSDERKIIQMATVACNVTSATEDPDTGFMMEDEGGTATTAIIALCDDGSVWRGLHFADGVRWNRLPDIPQN